MSTPDTNDSNREVLDLASLAGHVLLENGAEIARVEDTMERITSHFGVDSTDFFVISNGIFTTGGNGYAKVDFIPFKGAQLEKVVAVNQLSRDISAGRYGVGEARSELMRIRTMPSKKPLVQILGSAVGSAGFCIIFGGALMDAAAAFVVGAILWTFVLFASAPYLSKLVGNIFASVLATALCIVFHRFGFGDNLGNVIIGSLIPLIPGIPFTNGIRDIAGEDYLAGVTRLLDALMVFFGIAIGVVAVFYTDALIEGSMLLLHGASTDPFTSSIVFQTVAAWIGTAGFAILFGVPRRSVLWAGVVGAACWLVFLLLFRYTSLGMVVSTLISAMWVVMLSRSFSRMFKTPATVFLITGIFPMVPGGGLFWTSYYIASSQLESAMSAGYLAVGITVAIVIGIVLASAIPSNLFRLFRH